MSAGRSGRTSDPQSLRMSAGRNGRIVGMGRRIAAAILGPLAILALVGLTACDTGGGVDRVESYAIAGGGTTGVYFAYGKHLAEALSAELDADFAVEETEGSVDNLLRIGSGEALIGFAQSDAAADAVVGAGAFEEALPIRAVARLYDEYVHVVVRADSEIARLSDLAGRAVSLGAPNSGVNLVAARVLDAAGVSEQQIENPGLGLDASIDALRNSEIDGFFWVGGLPTPGIDQLARDIPIRLLSIDPWIVERVNATHAGVYRVAELPMRAYGREESTVTMTVPNYLVVSASAPAELVHEVTETLFESRSAIAKHVPAAALLDRRQAIFTDPIELHPGAVAYYRETRR